MQRNPLAELRQIAPGGPWSHRRIHRAGGPCPETMRLAERGEHELRGDSIARLAAVLGMPEGVVRTTAAQTFALLGGGQ